MREDAGMSGEIRLSFIQVIDNLDDFDVQRNENCERVSSCCLVLRLMRATCFGLLAKPLMSKVPMHAIRLHASPRSFDTNSLLSVRSVVFPV